MIELTPKEVEACRRLKQYTEKQLAIGLYDAIEYPVDDQTRQFMLHVRDMSKDALKYIKQITALLKDSGVRDKTKIEKMLRAAGPLAVYYTLDNASSDLNAKNNSFKNIEKIRDEKIDKYKKDVRTLEETERNLNKNINTLLFQISKKQAEGKYFDDCKVSDSVKDIVSPEAKDIIDSNNLLIDVLSDYDKDKLQRWMVIEGCEENDGYFEVKKHLDLEINRLYTKIEWQKEYAEGLKRQATADNCSNKLEMAHIDKLIGNDKLSPSDCSDIFRLLGTMMEELDKLESKDWEKLNEYYTKPDANKEINLDHLKFCIQLQTILRETSGLDIKGLFPDMPPMLANKLTMPEKYQIDKGERFVKYCEECGKDKPENGVKDESNYYISYLYKCPKGHTFLDKIPGNKKDEISCTYSNCKEKMIVKKREWWCNQHDDKPLIDMIEQKLKCGAIIDKEKNTKCGNEITLYFEAAKHAKEKPAAAYCSKCKKETKFEPAGGVKPFWKDEIRARWRDTWSSTFILEYNSIVRAIDRTFGISEVADISGTTADSIFGMEAVMNLSGKGTKSFGTQAKTVEFQDDKDKYWSDQYRQSGGYPGYVILLPLITMVRHSHHAIIECALTFTLTGYIDAYHIGDYTSLWPKGSAQSGALWEILKYWEESPSNVRILIERDKDGFVERGWLLNKNEVMGGYRFNEINKLNYLTYINVFLELRNKMRDGEKVDHDVILELMLSSDRELGDLEIKILDENAKRLKDWSEKNDSYGNYNEYAQGLKEYSEKDSIPDHFKKVLADLSSKYPPKAV
jgi:hypothetical protein